MNISITPYDKGQYNEVVDLAKEIITEVYGREPNKDSVFDVLTLNSDSCVYSNDNKGVLLVVSINNKVIGMGGLRKLNSMPDVADTYMDHFTNPKYTGIIARVYIKSDYRRLGIGKKIYQRLLDAAKMFSYSHLYLNATRIPPLATYWEQFGFQEFDHEDDYYQTTHMILEIGL